LKLIAVEKRGVENDISLLNEIHSRKLDNLYIQKEKQIRKHLDSIEIRDEFYYEKMYHLARANTSHFKFIKSGYTFDLIQNEFDIYLRYTLIVLLRNYSKMLTNKHHGNVRFNLEMFENVWEYVKDKQFEDNPSSMVYKQIISLELSKEEKDYKKLVRLKEEFEDKMSGEDMYYLLLVANSFAAYKLKQGDESYYRDRFRIFKELIDRKIQLPEYILFVNFITNYTSACMVGEFEWAEDFMNRFRDGISPAEETSNTLNYCKGFLAYRHKEYDKALEYFAKTNFKLFIPKVMVKSHTLRILYEQNLFEQTFSSIDSFRHYLRSEKLISEDQKTAHYDFLKCISDLTKLREEGIKDKNDARLLILREQIRDMQSNPLGCKNWLIEKLATIS
jgi:hypothetical protein